MGITSLPASAKRLRPLSQVLSTPSSMGKYPFRSPNQPTFTPRSGMGVSESAAGKASVSDKGEVAVWPD